MNILYKESKSKKNPFYRGWGLELVNFFYKESKSRFFLPRIQIEKLNIKLGVGGGCGWSK